MKTMTTHQISKKKVNIEVVNLNGSLTTDTWFLWKIYSLSLVWLLYFAVLLCKELIQNLKKLLVGISKSQKLLALVE